MIILVLCPKVKTAPKSLLNWLNYSYLNGTAYDDKMSSFLNLHVFKFVAQFAANYFFCIGSNAMKII